jgi:hypothetical protein
MIHAGLRYGPVEPLCAGTPAWLRVSAFFGNYTNRDPDQIWVPGGQWGGLSVGNGIFSVPNYVPGVIVKVVCHEAAHATKSFFERDDFGRPLQREIWLPWRFRCRKKPSSRPRACFPFLPT